MNTFGNLPTLLSLDRICNLIKYSTACSGLGGYMASFGVYKGGSLEIIAKFSPGVDIVGIDSFQGFPPTSEHDFHVEGEFADTDAPTITGYMKWMHPNVKVLKGFSPKVFEYFEPNVRFCFVYIDVDLYQSVLDGLDFFLPRMHEGGIILMDDYKVRSCPGVEVAVNEFFANESNACSYRGELLYHEGGNSHFQYLIKK